MESKPKTTATEPLPSHPTRCPGCCQVDGYHSSWCMELANPMKTTEEHLTELLNAKDETIEKLERIISKHDSEEEKERLRDAWEWTRHFTLDEDDADLPVPRLELRWEATDKRGYNRTCWYFLVYKHFLGYIVKVPIGHTAVSGGREEPFYDGSDSLDPHGVSRIHTPFRDGAHIRNEARQLNLPAFVIWKNKVQEILSHAEHLELGPLRELTEVKADG